MSEITKIISEHDQKSMIFDMIFFISVGFGKIKSFRTSEMKFLISVGFGIIQHKILDHTRVENKYVAIC